jgi:hypothetical protein
MHRRQHALALGYGVGYQVRQDDGLAGAGRRNADQAAPAGCEGGVDVDDELALVRPQLRRLRPRVLEIAKEVGHGGGSHDCLTKQQLARRRHGRRRRALPVSPIRRKRIRSCK